MWKMKTRPPSLTFYEKSIPYTSKIRNLETIGGKPLKDIGIGNTFLNRTPIAQKIRTKIENWNC
jgi:hypothetical protein